ncbi:MAG: hypothetical protein KGL03_11365, partial [Nitrospirota bacterium]|nr:hypothetical protein [Nitrospirota bacterium]
KCQEIFVFWLGSPLEHRDFFKRIGQLCPERIEHAGIQVNVNLPSRSPRHDQMLRLQLVIEGESDFERKLSGWWLADLVKVLPNCAGYRAGGCPEQKTYNE